MSGTVGDNTARASGVIASAGGGDFVKIATAEVTGSVASSIDIQGCFTSTYDNYQIHFNRLNFDGSAYFFPVFLDDSNAAITADNYYTKGHDLLGDYDGNSDGSWKNSSTTGLMMTNGSFSQKDQRVTSGIIYLPDPRKTRTPGSGYQTFWYTIMGGQSSVFWRYDGIGYQSLTTPYGGIQFKGNSDNIEVGFKATVYGLKT